MTDWDLNLQEGKAMILFDSQKVEEIMELEADKEIAIKAHEIVSKQK